MKMDLNFNATRVDSSADNYKQISVSAEGVDSDDVLENFTLTEVVQCFGETNILDFIGVDTVKQYFDLKDNES